MGVEDPRGLELRHIGRVNLVAIHVAHASQIVAIVAPTHVLAALRGRAAPATCANTIIANTAIQIAATRFIRSPFV